MDVNVLVATAESLGPTPLPEEIAGYEDSQDPAVKGSWEITTATSADWALARAAECQAEADAIDAQYAAAVARLAKRRDELKARAERGSRYFEFKLAVWAEKNRGSLLKGKSKSAHLLHGTIGWRKKGGRLVVTDKDALVAWLATQPIEAGLYRMKLEPEMSEIQSLCRNLGEVPPGTTFDVERDEFYVKPEAPEAALMKGTP
jgi:phage host-nuclease inhibitor protein Gam